MKYRIAIITAYIGNGGNTGELTISTEAQAELECYGIDIFRFSDNNLQEIEKLYIPEIKKEDYYKEKKQDKLIKKINKFKFNQKQLPSEKDNHTRLLAKIPKMLFYKLLPQKYDYYIWLDSKFTIHKHWLDYILWLIERNHEAEIITSYHSERKSIKEEYEFLFEYLRKGDQSICTKYNFNEIANQYHFFKKKKNYIDNKLYELTMIIYSSKILNKKAFLEEWYSHNYYFSIQDQLSFPYLCYKHKINVKGIEQRVFDMPFVTHEYSR